MDKTEYTAAAAGEGTAGPADATADATATDWYSDDIATLGDRLEAARVASHMTLEELSERVGVQLIMLEGWEQDSSEPSTTFLPRLAGILNVSLTWLLIGEGEGLDAPTGADAAPQDLTPLLAELRSLRINMRQQSDQLGKLEKKLRHALKAV
ncbi:helix-turn-helix domain-containing protein [Candidatus Halocynthiibacter alkanivorans]|uniref:helix-turn-helix domain-containing protein n=1 Tax=Candidatus Halocynthiibacter alkanivorans TaxID=2267619 RepID=UPI001F2BC9EB|nr:helix-turn-helix domain-containing protein [Candidatus Halocynthiibacter alkanivorans]